MFTGAWPCRCLKQEREDVRRPNVARRVPEAYPWRRSHGCDAKAPRPVGEFDGARQYRCLRAIVLEQQPEAFQIIRMADFADQGVLPDDGGLSGQSALLMDAIDVLRVGLAEGRAEMQERERPPDKSGGSINIPTKGHKPRLKPQRLGRR